MSLKFWERYSFNSLASGQQAKNGNLLISDAGQVNTSNFKILHSGVDTVRQLYKGLVFLNQLEEIAECYRNRELFTDADGVPFVVGGAMQGGFKYRLQNNELGVIILLKNRFKEATDPEGSHIKIELSPHFILKHDAVELQQQLDKYAKLYLNRPQPVGCAVHLAVDFQGFKPDSNFLSNFVCRSKTIRNFTGLGSWELDSGNVAVTYNAGESMLFGTARGLQCAIYNKTKEALHRDKLDFWRSQWEKVGGDEFLTSAYNPDLPVWRVEFRFHQSIINEFASGTFDKSRSFDWINKRTGELISADNDLQSFIDLVPHLTGLWRAAALSFRLDVTKGKLINPFWQCLRDDVAFFDTTPELTYKRVRKTPGQGNEKNIQLALGNLISIYARKNFSINWVLQCLTNSGFWEEIKAYFTFRGFNQCQIKQFIEKRLIERRLLGKAA